MRARNRIVAVALATLGALLGGIAPASAIVGGMPDGNRHPNVGVLAWDADGVGGVPAVAICGGAVISDHAFLTARHCIEPPLVTLPPGVHWAVSLEPGSPSAPIAPGGFFPDDYPVCCGLTVPESKIARATGVVLHPDYEPGFVPGQSAPTAGAHDVAVVLFPPGTFAGVRPVEPARPGTLDHLRAHGRHGPDITLVGYGTEIRDGRFYAAGYRKTARVAIAGVAPNWLLFANAVFPPPRGGAACVGDSGSPQLLAGSNLQVSILHDAGPACTGTGYGQRIDTRSERRFIAPFLPRRSRCDWDRDAAT